MFHLFNYSHTLMNCPLKRKEGLAKTTQLSIGDIAH